MSQPQPSQSSRQAQQAQRASASAGRIVRRVILVMLAAIVLYGAMVLYRGVADIRARFADYAWWTLAGACGLAFGNYLLRFLKWEYYLSVLEIRGIPKGESLLTFLSGFVLTVTPGKVGEVFKSLVLYQTRGVPMERSAPIIVAERITDLIAVIAMIAIGSLGFEGGLVWAIAGAFLVLGLLLFIASPRLQRPVLARLPRLPGPLGRLGTRCADRVCCPWSVGHSRAWPCGSWWRASARPCRSSWRCSSTRPRPWPAPWYRCREAWV
jgi:hypothetical protein